MKSQSLAVSEEDVLYACRVLDALAEAFDRIAAEPKLGPQFTLELVEKAPEILDALLAITREDCRVVLFDLGKSAMNLVKACLVKKKPKP